MSLQIRECGWCRDGRHGSDCINRPADKRDIDLVTAWLQEQNVGEELESYVMEDDEFGEWHQVLHVENEGRYLVVPLDPKEGE